jgi:hypothetical protein
MAELDDSKDKANIAASLRRTMAELVVARRADPEFVDAKNALRAFQNRRFAHTYADLARDPRYQNAIAFFLYEMYGDADMSARDADLVRVLPLMTRMLPTVALQTILDALAFEALSERLDSNLARCLGNTPVDESTYAAAFVACGQRELRERQMRYVGEIGRALDRMTRWPMIKTSLKVMRAPARAAGLQTLQEFLENGYNAFAQMHGADAFIATIARREAEIVERLFAGHSRPFDGEDRR